jgi:hypothetical protein
MREEQIDFLRKRMRAAHYELCKHDYNSHEYFTAMSEEVLKALDEYYGAARYWMAAEFERERLLASLTDWIEHASFSPRVHVRGVGSRSGSEATGQATP